LPLALVLLWLDRSAALAGTSSAEAHDGGQPVDRFGTAAGLARRGQTMSVQPITTSPPGARDAGPSSPDGASAMLPDGASVVLRGVLSKRSTQHFLYQQRTFTLCAGADGVVHSLRYRS